MGYFIENPEDLRIDHASLINTHGVALVDSEYFQYKGKLLFVKNPYTPSVKGKLNLTLTDNAPFLTKSYSFKSSNSEYRVNVGITTTLRSSTAQPTSVIKINNGLSVSFEGGVQISDINETWHVLYSNK